jgi:hypothetical protein
MADNISRNINVIYQLFSNELGLLTIQEPKGYENDTRGYDRDADSRSFIVKTSIDLEFFGDGADYLYRIFRTKGIQEKVTLTKFERDVYSISEEFLPRYVQEIDLGTLKRNSRTGSVTVNATEGGLFKDIKNRQNDEYDLINNLSADGIDIGELQTKVFKPIPRSLFFESAFESDYYGYRVNSVARSANNSITRGSKTIPLKEIYISGDRVQLPYNSSEFSNPDPDSQSFEVGNVEDVGNIFFWRSDVDDRKIVFDLDLEYTIKPSTFRNVANPIFQLVIKKSKLNTDNNTDDVITEIDVLQTFNPLDNINVKKTYKNTETYILNEGESLSVCFQIIATAKTGFLELLEGVVQIYMDVTKSKLTIRDDNDFVPTVSRCLRAIDFFDRIIAKITGKTGLVVSDCFTNGIYKDIVVDNGLWARQFKDNYIDSNDEEQSIQMVISFEDGFEAMNYLEPLCWFTFFDGNTEKVRIEPAKFTQQNFIGLSLGEVSDINSESSKMDFYSSIKIGQTKSLEYEELYGLDEPNGLTELSTINTKNISVYEATSKIRLDSVGYELTRRKPFDKFPKEDTKRDADLWMHDAKKLADGSYTHLLWNDTINGEQLLDELPKGVFRPDNLWNFRLSPMNRLYYGHSYSVKRGVYHYPKSGLRFSSSNANQNLITIKNGYEIKENGVLIVEDLPKAKVEPEKINFTFKMTQEIEDKLLGFTSVNKELVPNYFGLISYIENNEVMYGRLIKLETQGEAKATLIKARL